MKSVCSQLFRRSVDRQITDYARMEEEEPYIRTPADMRSCRAIGVTTACDAINGTRNITDEYLENERAVVKRQLEKAGIRLAHSAGCNRSELDQL